MKRYKLSSAGKLWHPFYVTVNDKGKVVDATGNGIVTGAKWESLKAYFDKFTGENAYIIEEQNDNG